MILQLIFHIAASVLLGFGIVYDFIYIKFPESEFQWHNKFGGKFKFLSVQNMFAQFLYFFMSFALDAMYYFRDKINIPHLRSFIDNYFAGLAFPLAIFVCVNFWALYFIKRDQIFPEVFARVVPKWHLHLMHTSPLVLMLIETFVCFREYPEFCVGLATTLTYMISYIAWLHGIKYFGGFWVYPLLNNKTTKEVYTYFASAIVQIVVMYMLGEILNNAIWSHELLHKNCGKHHN